MVFERDMRNVFCLGWFSRVHVFKFSLSDYSASLMTYPAAGHHIVIAEFGELILIKSIIINQQHFVPYEKLLSL